MVQGGVILRNRQLDARTLEAYRQTRTQSMDASSEQHDEMFWTQLDSSRYDSEGF
jgi:hypothetical protein